MSKKIILNPDRNLALGDITQMTIAVRDLALAYPGEHEIDIRTPFPELWFNNPYITPIQDSAGEPITIGYGLINNPGSQHFSDAFRLSLAEKLGIQIPYTIMNPDLHLTKEEKDDKVVARLTKYSGKYWAVTAGWKADGYLKYYPFYQEVIDLLKNKLQFVQIGAKEDHHPSLNNVINIVGKTSIRDLLKLIYQAQGSLGAISAHMHIAAAFKKPCVVIGKGTEPPRWEMYNQHRFLSVCGCLPCAPENGCWRAKDTDCDNLVGGYPRCAAMIPPAMVAWAVESYYNGGILNY